MYAHGPIRAVIATDYENNFIYKTSLHSQKMNYHYTKITVVRLSVCESGRSPEASRPQRSKLCFSAKLKSDATTRGSLTRPATALAPN